MAFQDCEEPGMPDIQPSPRVAPPNALFERKVPNRAEQKGLPCSWCLAIMKLNEMYFPYQGEDICRSCWGKSGINDSLIQIYYVTEDDLNLFPPLQKSEIRNQSNKVKHDYIATKTKFPPIHVKTNYLPLSGKPIMIYSKKRAK